jgi:hypothetical protein
LDHQGQLAVVSTRLGTLMARLDWAGAPRVWEEGVNHGVLYSDGVGVAWNGLIAVTEAASGTQDTNVYFDGHRLVVTQDISDFEATIEAYTYPDEFEEHSGFGETHSRKRFGLSYRTQSSEGDKLHIVYDALVNEPDRSWSTISDTPEPSTFQWDIVANAVNIPGARPSSHLVVDLGVSHPALVTAVENWLYGTSTEDPRLPDPEEIIDIFEAVTTLRITYNGDGTYTADGPDTVVEPVMDGQFQINAPTALFLDESTFQVQSF